MLTMEVGYPLSPVGIAMRITVCQLHNGREGLTADWDRLVEHIKTQRSELVLLPEMPFYSWFPTPRNFDAQVWSEAVAAHEAWEKRLSELMPAIALGTRPVDFGNLRYSAGFMWNEDEGIAETIHVKTCLSNEEGAWETTWYERAVPDFEAVRVGDARVGMLIGLELWMTDQARFYGEDGVHIIAVPRVDRSGDEDIDVANQEWLDGGRTTAKAAGAYCISSSRGARGRSSGGAGWVIAPDGQTLAMTSREQPLASIDIDLSAVSRHPHAPAPMGMPLIDAADVRSRR
jgi:predicted amidohydrolase